MGTAVKKTCRTWGVKYYLPCPIDGEDDSSHEKHLQITLTNNTYK